MKKKWYEKELKEMNQKNIIWGLGILFGVILILLIIFGVFGFLSLINPSEPGSFYQDYPQKILYNDRAVNNYGDIDFSQESTIKTDTATFRIKITKLPYQTYRSAGHRCGSILSNYEIYRNNVLIDTINTDQLTLEIQKADSCTIGAHNSIYRAYADDGTIYKNNQQSFDFQNNEVYTLPPDKNGIEILFTHGWNDGGSGANKRYHVRPQIRYVLNNQAFNLKVDNGRLILNSNGNYNLDYEVIFVQDGMNGNQKAIKQIQKGDNFLFNFDSTFVKEIIFSADVYKITSDFSGVNAESSLFYPLTGKRSFSENQKFNVGEIKLNLKVQQDIPEPPEPKPSLFEWFGNVWSWIKGFFN